MAGSNSAAQRTNRKGGLGQYFRQVKAELKKVVWPTKKELITYTIATIIISALVAFLIYVVDAVFAQLFNALIRIVG